MSHLPVEILDQILGDLLPHYSQKLAPLATINQHWQSAVEAILWRYIQVTTTDIELFTVFCQTRTRKQAVRHIVFDAEYFKQQAGQESIGEDDDISGHGMPGQEKDIGSEMIQKEDELVDTEPGCGRNNSTYRGARHSLSAVPAEHFRFFRDTRKLWVTLARTEVKSIQIIVDGCSFYKHLGPDGFQMFLSAKDWLGQCPGIPVLPSVETFTMKPKFNTDVDLWTAIVGCAIAHTLPALKELTVMGDDRDRRWVNVKRDCREVLAMQLANLPSSLQRFTIWLEHDSTNDQRIEPDIFLVEGIDKLSTAVHRLSRYCGAHLTELFLNVDHISPSLFWNAGTTSSIPIWPNLSTIDVRTGFETAAGAYWMRSDSDYPASTDHLEYYFDYEPDSSDSSSTALAESPVMYFRIRPEPELFDALAISIAYAISHMPKLTYLNIEFNAHHRGVRTELCEHFKNYEGWACYFRAENNARFSSSCFRSEWPDPGPDWTCIERPRLEWVFQCPFSEVQWKQPEEADVLWRERFPDVDFDLITLVYQGYKWYDTWERRRDDKVIERSQRKGK